MPTDVVVVVIVVFPIVTLAVILEVVDDVILKPLAATVPDAVPVLQIDDECFFGEMNVFWNY